MLLTKKEVSPDLPEIIIEAAAETAKSEEKEGWAFTLHAPSYVPFMTYSDNRDLRQKSIWLIIQNVRTITNSIISIS